MMNKRHITPAILEYIEMENAKQTVHLSEVPRVQWPPSFDDKVRLATYRCRRFLVQVFEESNGIKRLSINRTKMMLDGRWADDIKWEEIQDIKRQLGFGDMYAIEVYPREKDVVNVANMRHIWILPEPLNIGWFRS